MGLKKCKLLEGTTQLTVPMKLQTLFRSSAPIFDQKKRLPAHTFCPLVGHKKKGFFFREQDLQENTLSAEEVFADPTERFDQEKNQDGG